MRRLYQRVARSLSLQINEGKYVVGQRLPAERLLAEEFNVSRPVIREAMIALEIAGIVQVRVGSGVYVVSRKGDSTAPQELDVGPFELMEARRVVESEVAALAVDGLDDDQFAKLDALLLEMEHENEIGVVGERADREFHFTIANATNNSALVMLVEKLWELRDTSPMVVNMLNRSRAYGVQPMIKDHKAVLDALKSRDKKAAREAMWRHLSNVIEALLEVTETDVLERAQNEAKALRKRYQLHPA